MAIWLPPGAEPDGNAIIAALGGSVSAEKHRNTSRSSNRWTPRIPKIRTGTYRGSVSILPGKELAWARTYSSNVWRAWTPITAPPSLKHPTREQYLYERHGFGVISISQAGACPPVTSMLRPAQ